MLKLSSHPLWSRRNTRRFVKMKIDEIANHRSVTNPNAVAFTKEDTFPMSTHENIRMTIMIV